MEYIRNKKASFDYSFEKTIEAGIELLGTEVKSVKNKHGGLNGAYIQVFGGEVFLMGAHIPAFQEKNAPLGFDPYRNKKLLLKKKEIEEILKALSTKGLTVIPISLYNKGSIIKIQIAIAKGKKNFDKRETIKARDIERDLARELS